MTRSNARTLGDERGAILLIALFFAVFAVAILYSLIATAEAITFRERLQDQADRAALSAAILHARAMNLIVLINLIMAALLAILVAIKLVELLAIVGIIVAAGLAWVTGGATTSAIPPLRNLQQVMNNTYQNLKNPVYTALEVLNTTANAVKTVTPLAATAVVASTKGVAVPTRLTLPVEDDRFEKLCEQAGRIAAKLALLPLKPIPGIGLIEDPIADACGEMTEALSGWFCGDGTGGPPSYSTKVKKSYPTTPDDEACLKSGQSASGSQSDAEALCEKSAAHQQAAKPDEYTGACRAGEDCSIHGPYETRVALARDQCDPTRQPKPHRYIYQKRRVTVEYEYTDPGWKRLEPKYEEPRRMESLLPPCGPYHVSPTVAEGYNRVVRLSNDVEEVLPVCSTEELSALDFPDQALKGDRVTVEYEEVTHILGCVTQVQETIKLADAEPGGKGGANKSPKRVEKQVTLGDEAFQLRSLVHDDLARLEARRLVRLALWGRKPPDAPLSTLRPLGSFGFAQAEYFYDGAEDREAWMWNMRWRARLVRFRVPSDPATFDGLTKGCGDNCGVLSTLGELENLIAH